MELKKKRHNLTQSKEKKTEDVILQKNKKKEKKWGRA